MELQHLPISTHGLIRLEIPSTCTLYAKPFYTCMVIVQSEGDGLQE